MDESVAPGGVSVVPAGKPVKLVLWDLDGTLWQGTILEGDTPVLTGGARELIEALDARGILQSIVSRNAPDDAAHWLRELRVAEYFLHPEIGWGAKSDSVARITKALNIGLDSALLIDDQPFEREEVMHAHPEVRAIDPGVLCRLREDPQLCPKFLTEESRQRRSLYRAEQARLESEQRYEGSKQEFLRTLELRLTIAQAAGGDLQRVEELVLRTNQLNTTGVTYSTEELERLRRSPQHRLLVVSLQDKFGDYGKIGLILLELAPSLWTLRLLLFSCRVMSRGIGAVVLNYLLSKAREARAQFHALYRETSRNRPMLITYRFAGFRPTYQQGDIAIFTHSLERIPDCPDYIQLTAHPWIDR